jgi:hypothetical protein
MQIACITYLWKNNNSDKQVDMNFYKPPVANLITIIVEERDTHQLLMQYKLHVKRRNLSLVHGQVIKVGLGRFIPLSYKIKKFMKERWQKNINTHIIMCFTCIKHLRVDLALIPLMGLAA